MEEYNYEMVYKPGQSNKVADALSRLPRTKLHNLTTESESDPEVESSENYERRNADTLIACETEDNVLPEIESSSSGTAYTREQGSSDLIPHMECMNASMKTLLTLTYRLMWP